MHFEVWERRLRCRAKVEFVLEMSSNIARELQQLLKQRESELSLAQGEIEERNALLTKASSVISSLQAEFSALKKESEQARAESNKVNTHTC